MLDRLATCTKLFPEDQTLAWQRQAQSMITELQMRMQQFLIQYQQGFHNHYSLDLQQDASLHAHEDPSAFPSQEPLLYNPKRAPDPQKILEARFQGYKLEEIADILGYSRRQIYNMRKYDNYEAGCQLMEEELDEILNTILQHTPHAGLRMACGALKARGYLVTQERVRRALPRLDPLHHIDHTPISESLRIPYQMNPHKISSFSQSYTNYPKPLGLGWSSKRSLAYRWEPQIDLLGFCYSWLY